VLSGTWQPQDGGTILRVRWGMSGWVQVFTALWLGFVGLLGSLGFVATLLTVLGHDVGATGDLWVGLVVPPGMLVFGVGLLWFGRYLARGEGEFLTSFLSDVLRARPRAEPPALPAGHPGPA
jgi:hypothetical protein